VTYSSSKILKVVTWKDYNQEIVSSH